MKTRTYSQEGSAPEKVQFSTYAGLRQSQQEPEVYDGISGVDALTYSDPWTPPNPLAAEVFSSSLMRAGASYHLPTLQRPPLIRQYIHHPLTRVHLHFLSLMSNK